MDIFFRDPNEIPLPPSEVRILDLRALVSSERTRVRIFLDITPFQKRPNAEVVLSNAQSTPVATVSILESIDHRMEFTMHIRDPHLSPGERPHGEYRLQATLFYTEIPPLPPGSEPEAPPPAIPDEPQSTIVDQREILVSLADE